MIFSLDGCGRDSADQREGCGNVASDSNPAYSRIGMRSYNKLPAPFHSLFALPNGYVHCGRPLKQEVAGKGIQGDGRVSGLELSRNIPHGIDGRDGVRIG